MLHILLQVPGFPGWQMKTHRDTLPSWGFHFCSFAEVKKPKWDTLSPLLWKPLLFFCIIIVFTGFVILFLNLTFYLVLYPIFVCKSIQLQLTLSLLKPVSTHQTSKSRSLPDFSLCLVFSTVIWSLWQSPHETNVKGHEEIFQDASCKPDFLRPFWGPCV